jgi:hypothetical protein
MVLFLAAILFVYLRLSFFQRRILGGFAMIALLTVPTVGARFSRNAEGTDFSFGSDNSGGFWLPVVVAGSTIALILVSARLEARSEDSDPKHVGRRHET